jgi:replication factor A1
MLAKRRRRLLLFQSGKIITGMKINELKPGMRAISIGGRVDNIADARNVNLKSGGTAQVADATISDETGSIKLSLWDEQLNMVNEGDQIYIENGYTQEFRGETSLNVGRYGKLKKI